MTARNLWCAPHLCTCIMYIVWWLITYYYYGLNIYVLLCQVFTCDEALEKVVRRFSPTVYNYVTMFPACIGYTPGTIHWIFLKTYWLLENRKSERSKLLQDKKVYRFMVSRQRFCYIICPELCWCSLWPCSLLSIFMCQQNQRLLRARAHLLYMTVWLSAASLFLTPVIHLWFFWHLCDST